MEETNTTIVSQRVEITTTVRGNGVVNDTGSSTLILSTDEISFILELRSNTTFTDTNVLPRSPVVSDEDEVYDNILDPVHTNCLGLINVPPHKLRKKVKRNWGSKLSGRQSKWCN